MSAFEGTAEFLYEDGFSEVLEITWHSQTRTPAASGRATVTRAATFLVPKYLKRPGEFVTISFGDRSLYGYYDDPMPGTDAVRYTFHSQKKEASL